MEIAGVVKDAGYVGGDKVLALADADDDWRAEACDDDLVGLGGGENAQGEGAGEALDGAADGVFEQDGLAGGFRVVLHLLDEVSDDFGVGFGDEFVAQGGEFALEIEIIFNDAVVHDDEAAGAVAMGMGVLFRGTAVGGPAGVADAEGALKGMFAQNLFKVGELAGGAADIQCRAGGAADGDACRVVAAVFETPQPFDDDRNYLLGTDVTNYAAHATILNERAEGGLGGGCPARQFRVSGHRACAVDRPHRCSLSALQPGGGWLQRYCGH